MAELGYQVESFTYSDTPRRAHSIAAQGGINAAKIIPTMAIQFTGFFMTPSKAATIVHVKQTCIVLAEVSNQIIDHCVAQGIPFAREYGGNLANRSFVEHRYRAPFMPADKLDNSSFRCVWSAAKRDRKRSGQDAHSL